MNQASHADRIGKVGNRIGVLGEEVWKIQHKEAIFCWEVEDVVEDGLALIDYLYRCEIGYRHYVLDNPNQFNEAFDQAFSAKLEELLRNWVQGTEKLLAVIDSPILDEFEVKGVDRLREKFEEAKRTLVTEDDVLQNPEIINLRDQAYEEYRAGKTEAMTC